MIADLQEALEIAGAEGALVADGFDDCILGIAYRCSCIPLVVYDADKIVEKLQAQGMSYEEAAEYYDFNIVGAWVGEGTPLFMESISTF